MHPGPGKIDLHVLFTKYLDSESQLYVCVHTCMYTCMCTCMCTCTLSICGTFKNPGVQSTKYKVQSTKYKVYNSTKYYTSCTVVQSVQSTKYSVLVIHVVAIM